MKNKIEPMPKKEELEEWFQINLTIVGTKGSLNEESEFEVYNKEELLSRLDELLPEGEFGYSIVMGLNKDDKGI